MREERVSFIVKMMLLAVGVVAVGVLAVVVGVIVVGGIIAVIVAVMEVSSG